MRAGLIGYPFAGKTTLFQAVNPIEANSDLASVPVPDERFEKLCEAVQPKKRTYATVELQDDAVRLPGHGGAKPSEFAEAARKFDLLIHVIREFDDPAVPFHDAPNPSRDYHSVFSELVLADLQLAENRLEKLAKSQDAKSPGKRDYLENQLFQRLAHSLADGCTIREIELDETEQEIVESYRFLTAKPLITAINCAENNLNTPSELEKQLAASNLPVFRLCAAIEQEIASLPEHERQPFFEQIGIERSAAESMIQAVYQALGLITFFTAGEKETRAWPLRKGSTALKAAATIHTDIAKGFIRAEVVHYKDFDKIGDVKECYRQNLMRLEGKDYVVQDGDIINIRNKS